MTQHHISVTVSRKRFAENIRFLKQEVAPAKLCVVMKANAYGHGLSEILPAAVDAGADVIGICTNPEAEEIRRQNADIPLLRLRMALPEELDESIERLNIQEQVGTWEVAEYLNDAGLKRGQPIPVHIKLDTGMGRGGFGNEEIECLKRVCHLPGLEILGIMTHLASADGKTPDDAQEQLDLFEEISKVLSAELPVGTLLHTHNSAATARLPEQRRDMVRVGASCYGVRTSRNFEISAALKPIMEIKTRVAQVRRLPKGARIGYGGLYTTSQPSLIATVPVGFGEGYPRSLFNKGIVLINGQRCPVVGRVSLNVTTIDVSHLDQPVRWGDEVVLIGEQDKESVTFEEMADAFDSVHTEINLMAGSMSQIEYID